MPAPARSDRPRTVPLHVTAAPLMARHFQHRLSLGATRAPGGVSAPGQRLSGSGIREHSTDNRQLEGVMTTTQENGGLASADTVPAPRAGAREWIGLAVIALPCLLYSMDLTVLHLAVPALSAALQPTSAQLLW